LKMFLLTNCAPAAPRAASPVSARTAWPLMAALIACLARLGWMVADTTRANGGHVSYALDDAYIHMALAKNLAFHGVWGVTSHEFSSASSSPLWIPLLALVFRVFGVTELASLALNVLALALALTCAFAILRRVKMPGTLILPVLLLMSVGSYLVALVPTGMEHVLHAAASLALTGVMAHYVESPESAPSRRLKLAALMLAAMVPAIRYEGLFLVFAFCLLLAARRRWLDAVLAGLAALVSPLLFGAVSAAHGWYWLPNSVILKAGAGSGAGGFLAGMVARGWEQTRTVPQLSLLVLCLGTAGVQMYRYDAYLYALGFVVVAAGLWVYLQEPLPTAGRRSQALAAVAVVLFLHISLQQHLLTYLEEAALVLVLAGLGFEQLRKLPRGGVPLRWATFTAGLVLMALPLQTGFAANYHKAHRGPTNIHEQQYQAGRFIQAHYYRQGVAAGDIGTISFLGDVRLLDLWGLGTRESGALRKAGAWNADAIDRLARDKGIRVAVFYGKAFSAMIPSRWVRAADWTISGNATSADDTVSIFAVDPVELPRLNAALREFSRKLPRSVVQRGKYLTERTATRASR
jgi:hypothetical protein